MFGIGTIWKCLSQKRRYSFVFIVILSLFASIAEVVSLGLVIPFVTLIIDPEGFLSSKLGWALELLSLETVVSTSYLVKVLSLAFAVAALSAAGLRVLLVVISTTASHAAGVELSVKIFSSSLYQPYLTHVSRNSSEIISAITQKVSAATSVLSATVILITSSVLLFSISTALVFAEPLAAGVSFIVFGSAYAIIAYSVETKLRVNSLRIASEQTRVMKALREGFSDVRSVLLGSYQKKYIQLYEDAFGNVQKANAQNSIINASPRILMEALAMVVFALFILTLNNNNRDLNSFLPVLALLAISAQRLLPLLQQIYGSWSVIAGSQGSIEEVNRLLEQKGDEGDYGQNTTPMPFSKSIEYRNVWFRYSQKEKYILKEFNLIISKGERIGVIGKTGEGKTTLLDLMAGLLTPCSGEIIIDGISLKQGLTNSWQKNVALVPQNIVLQDATILENITMRSTSFDEDVKAAVSAAKEANVFDFIQSLPEGFATTVGERGVRLSGGQKQRIGIARALYQNASALIFDEATSALDAETEDEVEKSIKMLRKDLTIILVAHRITSLRGCDRIVTLSGGKVKNISGYEDLQ